jgi:hypothetical protein
MNFMNSQVFGSLLAANSREREIAKIKTKFKLNKDDKEFSYNIYKL